MIKINTRENGPHNSCWEKNHVEIYHCYPLETFCSHFGWGARNPAKKHTKIPWLGHQFIHQTNLLYGYSFEYFIRCIIWSVIHGTLNISGRLYRQQIFILLITISPMYNKLQRLTIALLVLSLLNSGSIVCCLLPSTHRFSCE